jgi:chromosome segregation ATPase
MLNLNDLQFTTLITIINDLSMAVEKADETLVMCNNDIMDSEREANEECGKMLKQLKQLEEDLEEATQDSCNLHKEVSQLNESLDEASKKITHLEAENAWLRGFIAKRL